MAGNPPAGVCDADYCEPPAVRCAKKTICRGHWLRLWGEASRVPGYDRQAWWRVNRDLMVSGALCGGESRCDAFAALDQAASPERA